MKLPAFIILLFTFTSDAFAQLDQNAIQTDFVLYKNRKIFDKYLRDSDINKVFAQPLDSNTEYDYESACLTASQFFIQSPQVKAGFNKLFVQYDSLQYATKRVFLEALYGIYPGMYENDVRILLLKETNAKLFAMQALYLFAKDTSQQNRNTLLPMIESRFTDADSNDILLQLKDYISNHSDYRRQKVPNIDTLFSHQKILQQKIIYSFQRWNRDYPGVAIIQNADGSFAKDSAGKLLMFQQLARAASNLPYFITDGNTPQGIFSITGTDVSHNNFLGPTPNIQMVMPFEKDSLYWHTPYDSSKDALTNYLNLLPAEWQAYQPITEAFYAGKIGRTEIIAHGTTIDPEYFKGKPFYPLTPTVGCLCAKEEWNTYTGKLLRSDQFNMVNAFVSTPGETGYLFVINLDDQQKAVSREDVEKLVRQYETSQ